MNMSIAYLAQGKLHLKTDNETVRTIESKFGRSIRERAIQIQQRNAWKSQGRGARFMSGGLLWGDIDRDPTSMRINITGISRGCRSGELLYALETDDIAGIFTVQNSAGEEQRLFHSAECRVKQVCAKPGGDLIACALTHGMGIANIAVMSADGSEFNEITEGDSIDLAPRWIPSEPCKLVFQSAGIGRDRNGQPFGHGPFAIHKLDLDSGEMTSLAEDPKHDLLGPQVSKDGTLYYIRRPYRTQKENFSLLHAILDTLLFPVRLFYAIFQWLNFFTVRYTGNPLTTAGGAKQRQADMKQMMVWGNLIDAEKAAREGRLGDSEAPPLVPQSWQLIRHSQNSTNVVAKGVLSFDLCDDGSIIYSNGSAVYRVNLSGATERLLVDKMIEQVVMVE